MRLMLRPGEFGRIGVEHVRRGREEVLVQLVRRKMDKKRRKNPWHLVECGERVCLACGLWRLREERVEEGKMWVFEGKKGF